MLEPREADIPVVLLFLVVLPLVTYILLGKWNEASKKNARINMLAQLAVEETHRVEAMATANVISTTPLKSGLHQCARCLAPATTRCSRCKSVRYCSGKCQIFHWRQGHKQECHQLQNNIPSRYSGQASMLDYQHNMGSSVDCSDTLSIQDEKEKPICRKISSDISGVPIVGDTSPLLVVERNAPEKKPSGRRKRETQINEEFPVFYEEIDDCPKESPSSATSELSWKGTPWRLKAGNDNDAAANEIYRRQSTKNPVHAPTHSNNTICEANKLPGHNSDKDKAPGGESYLTNGKQDTESSGERSARGMKFKKPPYTIEPSKHLLHKSAVKVPREKPCSGLEATTCVEKKAAVHVRSNDGVLSSGDSNLVDVKKLPKLPKRTVAGIMGDSFKRNKMLFPYEELVKLFQCEACDVAPRGLLNCGNSCYANAVLQCLTCTKPLMIYLLRRMHSKTCSARDWCLMCELELHVSMLQESGGPLSPSRILSNMRNICCRIGSGTQEDAHEFLRLLVTSMQSICLEALGGEKEVDMKLQETTLIQQTFGGRLSSKVKCLRCQLESERYENIMDLTLEIHGWVESLEDALTQFTAPEDLDGENMYRCGRCSTYVKARKQLRVHEVPNILTIVLKRFQTGKYGKINKYVTFPDLLDMMPFVTDTGDSPPLYMLYAVVVHLDTCNASFTGHYVSYVKGLQGTWFKIDDSEVQSVPFSRVMSEGAYMLFYSRSFPRPPRSYSAKSSLVNAPAPVKHLTSKAQMPSGCGQSRQYETSSLSGVPSDVCHDLRAELDFHTNEQSGGQSLKHTSRNFLPPRGSFAESINMDYSDATSSDWSIFTSSDESSFTTECMSDSFSIADYGDTANLDPISSLFSPFYIPEHPQDSTVPFKILIK